RDLHCLLPTTRSRYALLRSLETPHLLRSRAQCGVPEDGRQHRTRSHPSRRALTRSPQGEVTGRNCTGLTDPFALRIVSAMQAKTDPRFKWTPSPVLPKAPVSFAAVGYDEMVERARRLVPGIAARAEGCERLRRLPDETERELHDAGLFRIVQPARVGGAEVDVGIFVDVCAEIARVCPSTAWNIGNLASHHWMLGYFPPETQAELWDVSRDVLIATSLAFPAGRGRKVDGG